MTTGKNQKSGMGKPKDGDENRNGHGDPHRGTGIPILATALMKLMFGHAKKLLLNTIYLLNKVTQTRYNFYGLPQFHINPKNYL